MKSSQKRFNFSTIGYDITQRKRRYYAMEVTIPIAYPVHPEITTPLHKDLSSCQESPRFLRKRARDMVHDKIDNSKNSC